MKEVFHLMLLLVFSVNHSMGQRASAEGDRMVCSGDPLLGTSYCVEKIGLQLCHCLSQNDLANAKKLVNGPEEKKALEQISEILKDSTEYKWKVIRTVKSESEILLDIFARKAQYPRSPPQSPVLQIQCEIDPSIHPDQFQKITVFHGSKVDANRYKRRGVSLALMASDQLHRVKARTLGTVIDSFAVQGVEDDLIASCRNILLALEQNDLIPTDDLQNLMANYALSESCFYQLMTFGNHYNRHVKGRKKLWDNSVKDANYYLRDAILELIDEYRSNGNNSKPYVYKPANNCAVATKVEYTKKDFNQVREHIANADISESTDMLLATELPENDLAEIAAYCGVYDWVQSRQAAVVIGTEKNAKLSSMYSILVRRLLEIMSNNE